MIRAAALQMTSVFGEVDSNRRRLLDLLDSIPPGVDLVVSPELVVTGYDLDGFDRSARYLAEPVEGPTIEAVQRIAELRRMVVVVGLLERGEDGQIYDTAVVVNPSTPPFRYRKTHLYPPETSRFCAGDRLEVFESVAGPIGVMICFEHAFPEIATTLALKGAGVITVPSAVPRGFEHLLTLRTRARAQDNQLFVVAANLVGQGFCGVSLIVGPDGRILAQADENETVIVADCDLTLIDKERRQEPALSMRRKDLYL